MAILTTSIARTTPAQKPRGLSKMIFFPVEAASPRPVLAVKSGSRPIKDIVKEFLVYQPVVCSQQLAAQRVLRSSARFGFATSAAKRPQSFVTQQGLVRVQITTTLSASRRGR